MLECVINISEGRRHGVIDALQHACGVELLDTHTDSDHNRSVFTLGGGEVVQSAERLTTASIDLINLEHHVGVHPRLGVVDVVPFVPIDAAVGPDMDLSEALSAREEFAVFAANSLGIPCFFYGPERTLPEIRRRAFVDLAPDLGPQAPDARSGAICVGARLPLVAYNLILKEPDLQAAKLIARQLRSPEVRALGLAVGSDVQVSCNLIAPWIVGPAQCYDAVRAVAPIKSAELVGLLAAELLAQIPPDRYAELDVSVDRTIEARLQQRR